MLIAQLRLEACICTLLCVISDFIYSFIEYFGYEWVDLQSIDTHTNSATLSSLKYLKIFQTLLSRTRVCVCVCVCVCVLSCSVVSALWDPKDCGPPGTSVHGILQARILEWAAVSRCKFSWPILKHRLPPKFIANGFYSS